MKRSSPAGTGKRQSVLDEPLTVGIGGVVIESPTINIKTPPHFDPRTSGGQLEGEVLTVTPERTVYDEILQHYDSGIPVANDKKELSTYRVVKSVRKSR